MRWSVSKSMFVQRANVKTLLLLRSATRSVSTHMNRASGGARPAPPPPLIVAADAPAAMQSDTPASAAETPDIPTAVAAASEDKEVGSAAAVCGNPSPSASLTRLLFFLDRTSTQTPDLSPNACLLQGILLCHAKRSRNSFLPRSALFASFKTLPFATNTRGLATASPFKSSSKSRPTPAMRHCSFRTPPSTPPLASTSATTSRTFVYHLTQPAAFINSPLGATRQRSCGRRSVGYEGKNQRFAGASCAMNSHRSLDTLLAAACFFSKEFSCFDRDSQMLLRAVSSAVHLLSRSATDRCFGTRR